MQLSSFVHGIIVKRPSAVCKTPYVADICLDTTSDTLPLLGHCPALGCCGLSDKDARVILTPLVGGNTKCQYRVELAVVEERGRIQYVGINPKLAEQLMYRMLETNTCPFLPIQSFGREKTFLNSRFDFAGTDLSGRSFVMEIKNVPLADYVDVPKKERKKYQTDHMEYDQKIAYFPDGYRKNSTAVVSPRALKHIEELETIARTTEIRAILCFMVQRTDAAVFQPSNIDLTYKAAVQRAWEKGVELYAVQIRWTPEGTSEFVRLLPIVLYEDHRCAPPPV